MAGEGVDAGQFTGGRALVPESLQGHTTDLVCHKALLGLSHEQTISIVEDLFKAIKDAKINSYNEMIGYIVKKGYDSGVATLITQTMAKSIPSFVNTLREAIYGKN